MALELGMENDSELFAAQATRIAQFHDLTRSEKRQIERRLHGED